MNAQAKNRVREGDRLCAILYRGAGLDVVWPQLLALVLIGAAVFSLSLGRFRKTLALTA